MYTKIKKTVQQEILWFDIVENDNKTRKSNSRRASNKKHDANVIKK